ncbi:MAG: hypothetical protein P4K83_10200 [Terracidiphilus sp.]|nr:hypothetical protein [Terracidiphilus sp.]
MATMCGEGADMEIAPVTGVRLQATVKAPPAEPGLSRVFDIALSRSGEDSYSSSNQKGTGGQDEDNDEDETLLEEEESENTPSLNADSGTVNFVA